MLVCFDLDDTLLDQRSAEHAAALHFADVFADRVSVTGGAFAARWRETTERHFQAFLEGRGSFQQQRRKRIRDLVQTRLSDDEADAHFCVYLEAYEANWRLFDDVKPCLEALSNLDPGIELGIITNAAQQQQERKLEKLGIDKYFSFVLSAEKAGYAKPHPAIFEQAGAQRLREGPLVYIGDNVLIDAQAATDAGWHGIWLNRGDEGGSSFPRTLTALSELPVYLERAAYAEEEDEERV